jgi:hypothetical protein
MVNSIVLIKLFIFIPLMMSIIEFNLKKTFSSSSSNYYYYYFMIKKITKNKKKFLY